MDYEAMGRRLARLRAARGLKQETMAKRLRMTRNNYQNYETGRTRIPLGQFPAIATALEMSTLAVAEYLGLVQPGEQSFDDFVRSEGPRLFLLTEHEDGRHPLGDWRSRGPIPAPESGDTSTDAGGDTSRAAEDNAPPTPRRGAVPPGSRYPRCPAVA